MTGTYRRRELLGTLGGIVLTTGCVGTSNNPDTASATDGAIRGVRVDGLQLVVELASDASVTTVNVIAPDGSTFASRDVATGATRVEADLGVAYEPGEYRVVGVRDGERLDERSLEIHPDLRIVQVGVGRNHRDKMPDGLGTFQDVEAWVRLENAGNGPITVEKLLLLGGVPNPTQDLENASEDNTVSGIFDVEQGSGEVDRIVIPADSRVDLFTNTLPFSFQAGGESCPDSRQTETFTVVLRTDPGDELSGQFTAVYQPTTDGDGCRVTVQSEAS